MKENKVSKLKKVFEGASPLRDQVSRNFSLFNLSTTQDCSNFVPANRKTDKNRLTGIGPTGMSVTEKSSPAGKHNKDSSSLRIVLDYYCASEEV